MTKTLELVFVNLTGNKVTMRIPDPKEDLTENQVLTAMNTIINKNIFRSGGGDLVSIVGARIVSRDVTELNII